MKGQRAKGKEQRAKSEGQRAKSNERRAKGKERRVLTPLCTLPSALYSFGGQGRNRTADAGLFSAAYRIAEERKCGQGFTQLFAGMSQSALTAELQ